MLKKHSDYDELTIAMNLITFIKEQQLLNRDLKSVNRIIYYYFNSKRNPSEENKVIDFLFAYLDMHGKEASILFIHVQKINNFDKIIKRLVKQYQNKFDFKVFDESIYQNSIELIKKNEKFKKYFYISIFLIPLLIIIPLFFNFQKDDVKIEKSKQHTKIQVPTNQSVESNENKTISSLKEEIRITKTKLDITIKNENKLKITLLIFKSSAFVIDIFITTLIFLYIYNYVNNQSIFILFSFISEICMTFLILLNNHQHITLILYSVLFNITTIFGFYIFFDGQTEMKFISIYLTIISYIKYFLLIEKEEKFYQYIILFTFFAIEMFVYILLSDNLDDKFSLIICGEILIFLFDIYGENSSFVLSNMGFITAIILFIIQSLDGYHTNIENEKISAFLAFLTILEYCLFIFKKCDKYIPLFIISNILIEITFLSFFNTNNGDNNIFIFELFLALISILINYLSCIIITFISTVIVVYCMSYLILDHPHDHRCEYSKPFLILVVLSTIAKYCI